ncbi:DNA mismatch endonuclease (patch repair protein) [Ochrobactrum sp. RC6B]|nr:MULTISPECIES: DNA mismatch endonuclease Vsr [Brucella/Ochrobactrum group]KAB2670027.1 DNA mismatch endonuclease Vsr [Ochrobactrum sp. LMG 5442]MBB3217248.1 DNA mismatch endonuclease (patch repair protein) [Ochrobactrum sp. RC6B]
MADVHDKATRSRNMAAIRATNTKPELIIRKGLHARGFRYRLHAKELPGKPDLMLPKYRAAVFINGCFWHGHDCHLFRWPATREEFWRAKIGDNVARDERNLTELRNAGWRIGVIWECALKGKTRRSSGELIDSLSRWLLTDDRELQIRGVQI